MRVSGESGVHTMGVELLYDVEAVYYMCGIGIDGVFVV